MARDWQTYCRSQELLASGDVIDVSLHTGRTQRVRVEEEEDCYHLISTIAGSRVAREIANPGVMAWERNRATPLVGFRVDDRGRMIGDAWVPKAGLTADEFQFYVRALAAEADRFEQQLTQRDTE